MRTGTLSLQEGASIKNATIDSGATFPANPNAGELFFINSNSSGNVVGLYIFSTDWNRTIISTEIAKISTVAIKGVDGAASISSANFTFNYIPNLSEVHFSGTVVITSALAGPIVINSEITPTNGAVIKPLFTNSVHYGGLISASNSSKLLIETVNTSNIKLSMTFSIGGPNGTAAAGTYYFSGSYLV